MIDVLVVGAGPTGLALAAHLQAQGASVRILDRRWKPRPSRAFVVLRAPWKRLLLWTWRPR